MTSLRFAAVALAITAAACSSKGSDHPPVSTEGTNTTPGGGGSGTTDGSAPDSAIDEDAGFDAEAGIPLCNLSTCPQGCCDPTNFCQQGNTSAWCGTGGGLCQVCAQSGTTCGASRLCQ